MGVGVTDALREEEWELWTTGDVADYKENDDLHRSTGLTIWSSTISRD